MRTEEVKRHIGRPRAIPEEAITHVLSLYKGGLGYRAVARELREEGISVDWTTVRRLIKNRVAGVGGNKRASDEF
ncbi:hypothetical protein ACFLX5_06320 [Chloroflexota bacterium]